MRCRVSTCDCLSWINAVFRRLSQSTPVCGLPFIGQPHTWGFLLPKIGRCCFFRPTLRVEKINRLFFAPKTAVFGIGRNGLCHYHHATSTHQYGNTPCAVRVHRPVFCANADNFAACPCGPFSSCSGGWPH